MTQDNAITSERVRILYERAFASINTALAAALIISYLLWGQLETVIIISWLVVMFAIGIVRYWLLYDYNKNKHHTHLHEKFEKRYSYATLLVGISWAFIIFLGLNLPDFEYRLYSVLLLLSLIAISVPIFSPSPKTIYFYIAPPLVTAIPLLLSRGGNDAAVGLAGIVFTIMVLRSSKGTYNTLVDILAMRYQTEKQAEKINQFKESLQLSQQRLLLHREKSPLGIIEWNTDFEILYWNPAAQSIFGYTDDDVLGAHITESIVPGHAREQVRKVWNELMANNGGVHSINENLTKDGKTILCEWHNTSLVDQGGNIIGVTSIVEDITEREKNEKNLRKAQKMDAIGKLTGGIAHDFNNMLGVVLGFSKILKKKLNQDDAELVKCNDQIIFAASRAAKLTSKLLEFSRKIPSFYETVNINQLLQGMKDILEKTLTPRIRLNIELEEKPWDVWLDKGRLEDSILNLCINSMHAMPESGDITIKTSNICLDDSNNDGDELVQREYVVLSVIDSGVGMTKDIQDKIFDPFFTTKGENGTGLGLSQVYGYMQQIGGSIQVLSEPDKGTQIDLYIPRHIESVTDQLDDCTTDLLDSPSGEETILVVDDETALLELAEIILTTYGYKVICAETGQQALEILKCNSVDLLLTDVIMPGMDGYQLANEVQRLYPGIKIQIVSGYVEDETERKVGDAIHENRLLKPYDAEVLLKRIRTLLDEKS